MKHTATTFVDYQSLAKQFEVGDLAYPIHSVLTDESHAGRVVAVYPAIGQIDLEFSYGSARFSVEDLQLYKGGRISPPLPEANSVPGGVPTDKVARLVNTFVKSALYWGTVDRRYRATKLEISEGRYVCPNCKVTPEGESAFLKPAVYKRQDGQSSRLLGCPQCMFLIKRCDIIGDPEYHNDELDPVEGDRTASVSDLGLNRDQRDHLLQMFESGSVSTVWLEAADMRIFTRMGLAVESSPRRMTLTEKGTRFVERYLR